MSRPSPSALLAIIKRVREHIDFIGSDAEPSSRISAGIANATLVRASNVLRGIEAVGALNLSSEVGTLGRVLSESLYNVMWIRELNGVVRTPEEQEENAQLLVDDSILDAAKYAQRWMDLGYTTKEGGSKVLAAGQEVRARRKLGDKGKLNVPHLKARIQESGGNPGVANYDVMFRLMCLDAHASIQSLMWAVQGPNEENLGRNLAMASLTSVLLIKACSELMGRSDWWRPIREEVFAKLGIPS